MIYEIVNPHMACTFQAPDLEVAALTMGILSNNRFGAEPQDLSQDDVPPFNMGGAAQWWKKKFGTNSERRMQVRKQDVICALQSILPGEIDDRAESVKSIPSDVSIASRTDALHLWYGKHQPKVDIVKEGWKIADKIAATGK